MEIHQNLWKSVQGCPFESGSVEIHQKVWRSIQVRGVPFREEDGHIGKCGNLNEMCGKVLGNVWKSEWNVWKNVWEFN